MLLKDKLLIYGVLLPRTFRAGYIAEDEPFRGDMIDGSLSDLLTDCARWEPWSSNCKHIRFDNTHTYEVYMYVYTCVHEVL